MLELSLCLNCLPSGEFQARALTDQHTYKHTFTCIRLCVLVCVRVLHMKVKRAARQSRRQHSCQVFEQV